MSGHDETRTSLVNAAKEAAQSHGWIMEPSVVGAMVDAVLPLVADAVLAQERLPYAMQRYARIEDAQFVRSLALPL